MASLPALPTFAGTRRAQITAPTTASQLTIRTDPKLNLARRLRAEDRARRTTSVGPPA
jgi:hypothetical protein